MPPSARTARTLMSGVVTGMTMTARQPCGARGAVCADGVAAMERIEKEALQAEALGWGP